MSIRLRDVIMRELPQLRHEPIEVRGCDLFEFTDGRISRKDSFWKIVD